MQFDYSRLRGKIKEKYGTQHEFAQEIGLSDVSLSKRLNNTLEFTQRDMSKTCDALEISASDIPLYFFALKVQKDEQKYERGVLCD